MVLVMKYVQIASGAFFLASNLINVLFIFKKVDPQVYALVLDPQKYVNTSTAIHTDILFWVGEPKIQYQLILI